MTHRGAVPVERVDHDDVDRRHDRPLAAEWLAYYEIWHRRVVRRRRLAASAPDGHQTIALAWSTTPESRWGDNRGFEFRRSRLRTPSPPDGRAVDRLADGEMALASGALVVRGDDRVHERVRADRVGEDDN
jgi:hypothetical protein